MRISNQESNVREQVIERQRAVRVPAATTAAHYFRFLPFAFSTSL